MTSFGIVGLTTDEAAARLARDGPNALPEAKRVSVLRRVSRQLRDPLNVVLIGACALTVATGDLANATVIAVVVILNAAIGVAQETRADHAISALARINVASVRVRRDDADVLLPPESLVLGDIVLLGEGDVVPADGEVVEASSLLVDESMLTGESIPVGRRSRSDERPGDALISGTLVVRGRGLLVVTHTGAASALGRIAQLMDRHSQHTPLQIRMTALSRVLAIAAVSLSALVLILGLSRGEPLEPTLLTAVSLAVAAVPESLPAVVSLVLALGASRMASRNAIVRRLPSVETLGSVAVLATDKTGTLTEGRMVVEELWTPRHAVTVRGEGFEPAGALVSEEIAIDRSSAPDVAALLAAAALCNDAALVAPSGPDEPWTAMGDPTEAALLAAAGKLGLSPESLERQFPRIADVPFDSDTQCMTTVHARTSAQDPRFLVVVKGSPESLCGDARGRLFAPAWAEAREHASNLAAKGFRVLAVAAGYVDSVDRVESAEIAPLGLIAINDPVKPAARSTIEACSEAGIIPILITGDHPSTARAVAERVGILGAASARDRELIVTGEQLTEGYAGDLTLPRVFARVTPAQKLQIIQAWKDRGASIAMTGDGVNDGPALRRADVGVAMGHRGTEVARQAADLVLADDDLRTLVSAVEEGRRAYANIRRFLLFGLAGGLAEILLMLIGPYAGLGVPLLAAQILWINLLTHGATGVSLGGEPVDPNAMHVPPRPTEESILGDRLWRRVLVCGMAIAAITIAIGLWGQATGRPWQSLVFLSLISLQLGVALGLRARVFTRRNPLLPLATLGSLALALAGIYLPILQGLLGTQALTIGDACIGVGASALGVVAARITSTDRSAVVRSAQSEPAPHEPGSGLSTLAA